MGKLHKSKVTFEANDQEQDSKMNTLDDNLVQQKYSGTNAIMNSMHKYASNRRFKQVEEVKKSPIKNPLVQYYMEIEKSQVFPKNMGLVHKTKPTTLIDCSN